MYSDSDSDNDYDDHGYYMRELIFTERSPELRVLESDIQEAKDIVHRIIIKQDRSTRPSSQTDRDAIREHRERPEFDSYLDWRLTRIRRFFTEIQGFHRGDLDLSGRTQSRYDALLRRWESFSADMTSLLPHVGHRDVNRERWVREARKFMPHVESVPYITNAQVWLDFRRKWKMPREVPDYEDLQGWYSRTLSVIKQHPTPKIQKLYLHDLPPEVVSAVFSHMIIEEARVLSATNRYLREVGLAHIFSSRRIVMRQPADWWKSVKDLEEQDDMTATVRTIMTQTRDESIKEARFLLSRPDICAKITSLVMGVVWVNTFAPTRILGQSIPPPTDAAMFGPLFDVFAEFLHSVTIEYLKLTQVVIDRRFATELLAQPKLSRLDIALCRTSEDFQEFILAAPEGFLQTNITYLSLTMTAGTLGDGDPDEEDDNPQETAWGLVALCPQLRLLHLYNIAPKNPVNMPSRDIWPSLLGPLGNVERLHLDGIEWDLTDLCELLQQVVERGPLRLTHLKIHSAWSVPPAMIIQLFIILKAGNAPLRVLSLDGLHPLPITIFRRLAHLFPDLEALSLVKRDNDRQNDSKPCRWDLPLYEYAVPLRGLAKLRYFGANFYWDPLVASPYVCKYLEPGFDAGPDYDTDADFMLDGRSVALPFAASCPALESFVLYGKVMPLLQCQIRRSPTSGAVLEIVDEVLSFSPRNFQHLNPTLLGTTFPFPS
ncbi:hypothetical protein EXIGLDRAFT_780268 [Exidia glandulosa HHB12029]|uniref:F-box domain-containing protein n=1 Tax=Exidia glandulosa HHB12029 TaxID=1314781 RepID=A0A165BP85_EXIGL|nr:hypothetical protein EXIGLDRAFT_780268 [Exidia glandulosa HHB12029]